MCTVWLFVLALRSDAAQYSTVHETISLQPFHVSWFEGLKLRLVLHMEWALLSFLQVSQKSTLLLAALVSKNMSPWRVALREQ